MAGSYSLFLRIRIWAIFFGLVLMPGYLCMAQENIRFDRLSVIDGLSQSDIRCMIQDKFGFLWVGTRDGLNRYDGLEFHRYRRDKNDSTSLQFNQIWSLTTDRSGDIWISSTGGISIYDYRRNSFQNFVPADQELWDTDVNHILLTGAHTALLSTNKGLVSFDRKQGRFFIDDDLRKFKGMRVAHAGWTSAHGLWVATAKGVFVRPASEPDWKTLLEDHSVYRIDFDSNGKVYLSTSGGLYSYDQAQQKLEQIVATPVTEVTRVRNGDLWVATYKVIVLDNNDALKYVLHHDKFNENSLSEDRARVLYQTRDDVIWVGTFGYGLNKFNPDLARFSYLNDQTSIPLSGNYVSAIFTRDDSTVLVGTSRGMDVVDLRKKSAKHFSSDRDLFQIFKIISDRDNNIWVSTSMGLMQYSGNKLVSRNSTLRGVYSFAEWDNTSLIVATRLDGIYLFNKTSGATTLFIAAKDLPEEISSLLVEENHVWVGCKDGLKRYDRSGQLMQHFTARNDVPGTLHASFVKSIFRDSKKDLWVGTWGGGLSKLNTDSTFTTYTEDNGLPNNVVYGIVEDRSGILWLSTNLGLSAFDPRRAQFRNFDFFDGLQSNEFNTGAYFGSPGGKMYFGGVNGLSFFDPAEVLKPDVVPPVLRTSITINGKPLAFKESDSLKNVLFTSAVTSGWKENDVGVTFTAIDFRYPQKHHFQYAVKDTTWYDIGNRRSLELINLPSGLHELKIRTGRPGGNWSRGEVLLTIDIIPPLWERPWFRIVGALVFLSLIFSVYRYRVVRLKAANSALNKLVNERTMEIQAMNEEIASQNDQLHELVQELEAFSYSVSHDLRAPLRSVIGYARMLDEDLGGTLDEESRRNLDIVQQNAARMNDLINDLLEFSKLNRQEVKKTEFNTESQLRKNILPEIGISMQHKAKINVNTLPAVYADPKLLSQVWINLISNAIKYSAKKEDPVVEIGSYREQDQVVFYVKDNGVGFDMKYVDKLFGVFQRLHRVEDFAGTGVGLALVQRIVTRHGGRVWAEGKVNEGATFSFSLPDVK
ncbi:hypothetical protein KK083_31025 [Fulvivirgaceae bacterium PWU4]|uniref:histidine kinase n=1 Tax=Chryseosolibacter histidini TaxID=2782349 RepID=A0AAP2DUS8_9BACT|nr:two-component regulator propeller domain-containing protein [Chryseosolibacter histidini]MBT1701367.1 hypothetical protein [Chryseosolibacter histidini]